MPIIARSVDDGLFTPKTLLTVLADLRMTVRPGDQQDAFWLIHPQAWELFAPATVPKTLWPVLDQPQRTIEDDPDPPSRLFGLPLHIRDEGQDWREVQIWAENHIERAVRRNPPGITISVPEFVVPVELPLPEPPTLRALLRKWARRVRR